MYIKNTPEFEQTLSAVRKFIKQEVYPFEAKLLKDSFFKIEPWIKEKRRQVQDMGLLAPHIPQKLGGGGLTLTEFAQLGEILGTTPYGHYIFNCQAPDAGNMELLIHHGTESQKEQYLKPLIAGNIRSCFSMTEPEFAGSNPVNLGTTAVKDGEDYIISGHKWFTSSAEGSEFAIVMAVTNQAAPAYQRASMFIVPVNTPGFELVRNISIMGETGEGYLSHAEIRYNDCRVSARQRIGAEGAGFLLAQERLGPGRIHHCMRWIGICERAFRLMCQRACDRQLSEGVMLGHKQTVQNWIAESYAQIQAARLMVLHTAKNMEKNGAKAVRNEISAIKFQVAGVLQDVIDKAIQTHGASGLTDENILSFWYRHERAARIYDGPDEVHKASLAKGILQQYGLKI
ncbi:MAG: acyl-CoA dehydrogenase family protein [Sphingobacteriales bacterium]|nr:MAG: acyl-CoA dehydrogenase family protein [Sphingobacteriales bacterium]